MQRASDNVRRSIIELGLASELQALSADEASRLYASIESRFSFSAGARWIWEHLRNPGASRQFADDRAFQRLAEVVPRNTEQLVFFPDSDEDVKDAYQGTIDAIVAVLGDCPAFEYFIAPFDIDWLVCENHHGFLVAVGEPVESRLRSLPPE